MIFVDTGAWFAAIVPTDSNYERAARWLSQNNQILVTTDYMVDETLTLLRARGEKTRAVAIGTKFFDGSVAKVHRISESELEQAWQVFRRFNDKDWSFTDCVSKVVIENLAITTAFVFDKHFQQFGSIIIVP